MNTKRPYSPRGNGRKYQVTAFSLPAEVIREIERVAEQDYGGNKSACVTAKLAEALGVRLEEEISA